MSGFQPSSSSSSYDDTVIIPPDGIVNLKDKQYPICELHSLHQYHHHVNRHEEDDNHHQHDIQSSSAHNNHDNNDNNNIIDNKCNEQQQYNYNYDPHYVYTRGHVDVTNFKKYLQSLPNSIWNDDNQDGK